MRRVRVRIGGRVQGVFFRATCAERARTLGTAGWVRNAAVGQVEAEFEGEGTDVAAMLEWCRHGPPGARVDGLEVLELPPEGATGFRVIR